MNTPPPRPSRLSLFLLEMKRRHIVRFALGYAAAAFVLLQIAEIVFPAFGVGETTLRILVVAVGLLFPPAMVLAWIFDVGADGIERTPEAAAAAGRSRLLPGLALLGVTVVVVGSLGLWLEREGVLDAPGFGERPTTPVEGPEILAAYDPGTPIRSLAVLPLEDFSDGSPAEYFTMGMQEELIAQLSQIPGLRVVSRTSVQRYAGAGVTVPRIGRELNVDAVIEGSVRRSADQVRITVQLIHAASDTHVWTQQYDRPLTNLLALQSEVALDIARQIQAELSPEETQVLQRVATRAIDPDAQDAYLRGRFEASKGTPDGLENARELFETAVEEDSAFAPALAGLAGTRFLLGMADSARSTAEVARAAEEARRALELDTTSLEAREVLTLIQRHLPSSGVGAVVMDALPRSIPGRTPQVPPAPAVDTVWFQALSQFGRQIEGRMRSAGVDPRSTAAMRVGAGRQLMAAGLFDEASDLLAQTADTEGAPWQAWELLGRARVAGGDVPGAVDALAAWAERGGEEAPEPAAVSALRAAVNREGATAFWRWTLGRLEARAARGGSVSPTDLAAARAGSGDVEGAISALEEAVARRDRGLVSLQKEPVWDTLRADPRFADIARRARGVRVEVRTHPAPPSGGRR